MRSLLALFARTDSTTQSDAAAAKPSLVCFPARVNAATVRQRRLYRVPLSYYTASEDFLKLRHIILILLRAAAALFLVLLPCVHAACAQEASQKQAEKPAQSKVEKPAALAPAQNAAQIELLETRYRFEINGDSRKEVHARVKINSELGVRQFARLNFDYNRSFEQIEIPLVRITHASGGTADILPSAITDNPNPAVVNAPAYQDVRVKSVRILGLEPGDNVEYRVITTVSHHPLAPDFWLDHSFDRTGVVSEERFEIDLPASRKLQLHVVPEFPYEIVDSESAADARVVYRWHRQPQKAGAEAARQSNSAEPDVILTTFQDWGEIVSRIAPVLRRDLPVPEVVAKSAQLSQSAATPEDKFRVLYDFVSQKLFTVDLPLGTTGFHVRPPLEVISSGYAIPEEKCALLSVLGSGIKNGPVVAPALAISMDAPKDKPPRISALSRILVEASLGGEDLWLDPSIEVAPFGLVASDLRGKFALRLFFRSDSDEFDKISSGLPFAASQKVNVDATLASDGKLAAKVHYVLRGDNELLLRVAFHQSPKEKWKDLAQLLSISDGFRGQVTSVSASDPYATREPFTLDYEITMPKFVDWSKKPVRIPALLPQVGLPDPPAKPAPGAATAPIELGTPLEVETRMTLHLPPGTTTVRTPTGTTVQRDYATFASQYSTKGLAITASRHINFLLREIPATRATDYNAFLRAVQSDEAQDFTLDREDSTAPGTKPGAPNSPAPTQAAQPKP
jgi:hypothetical protein